MGTVPNLESFNLWAALPGISVAAWACILLLIDLFIPKTRKETTAWLAAGGLVFAFIVNLLMYNAEVDSFLGLFRADQFTAFFNIVILITAFISILLSMDYVKRVGIERGEFYILLLFSTAGMMFMGGANDLIVVFVALELLSIPLYILAAFRRPDLKSEEAGMKYFILGAFSSAFFVYGAALLYGATGSTNLPEVFEQIGRVVGGETTGMFLTLLGSGLVLVGLGFKVAVVPFHMWTPDVYEGAPTPVTAFMSVGAKAGGFGALLRILAIALPTFVLQDGQTNAAWQNVVVLVTAATLILGNFVAIAQSNIKRMLAYSSIAHAGYISMAVAAAGTAGVGDEAIQAALVYLIAYMFTNLGAFAVAMAVEKNDGSGTHLDDFVGLGKSRPLLAIMMTVFMLSLAGVPPTAGFLGKALIFQTTLHAGLEWLAIIGVVTSVVSAFYYLRVVVNMYLREGEGDPAEGATKSVNWAVYVAFAGTLLVGILPILVTTLTERVALLASIVP
jgi:NADH-quinone oxidoreductase subunit N